MNEIPTVDEILIEKTNESRARAAEEANFEAKVNEQSRILVEGIDQARSNTRKRAGAVATLGAGLAATAGLVNLGVENLVEDIDQQTEQGTELQLEDENQSRTEVTNDMYEQNKITIQVPTEITPNPPQEESTETLDSPKQK